MRARVLQRLVHRQVRVLQLDVLADERDLDDFLAPLDSLVQIEPVAQVGLAFRQAELLADEAIEALAFQPGGHEVDVGDVGARDHRLRLDVCEERDLLADVGGELFVRAADDDVRVDTDATQLVHGVLRRLRLQLAGGFEERHERDVQVEHVLGTDFTAELPDRLEERQRLDVAHRPADLADHDIRRRRDRARANARLDLVRDVRDHLNRRAEEFALAFLAQHRVPDRAGGVTRRAGEVLVDEALVVADVEIRLGAVFGDEDLAVLERAHRSGVDVQVRIELLRLDAQPARLQQPAE